jgi:hypothetical protein
MNSRLLFTSMILVIVVAIFELQQIILTIANNVHAEWIIPSQLNEAYNNTANSTASAVRGQNNQPITNIITTENSSSAGK